MEKGDKNINLNRFVKKTSRAQVAIEYIIIVSFVMFILIGVIATAFYYSGGIKDRIKIIQINNFANKIISTSETIYYYGDPSKATISVYIPEGVNNITVTSNSIVISTYLTTGQEITEFSSKVPLTGSFSFSAGVKTLRLEALSNSVRIS
ncbi:MAG: hypothetical protein Q8N99_01615 [Nanoarchaeota archaeon]|nr:hypothetical protein [Nanoarchaeota archaeon]